MIKQHSSSISHIQHNLIKAETEKLTKYHDLTIEFKQIYRLNSVETIPIVVSSFGLISKNLKKLIEKLELNADEFIQKIQHSVILETCRITRKILNIKD